MRVRSLRPQVVPLAVGVSLSVHCGSGSSPDQPTTPARRPNIVFILAADPDERQNQAAADRAVMARLSSWLDALSHGSGASCRTIETTPP